MPPFLPFYYLCHINPQKIMELLSYFYHPNYTSTELSTSLGSSSSWITDRTGDAIQHLHYLPYGEDWVDQRNSSWNVPYTFSGKETDVETGYSYFGARYYDSGLSIWLSVDPMSDKYPSMSPYNYCANNPVILVDPDGREPIDPRTGAQYNINFYVATMYQPLPDDIPNPVFDKSLWEQATPFFERSFNKPDGLYDGISFISRGSSLRNLSNGTIQILSGIFPNIDQVNNSCSAPNDYEWRKAARNGSYIFVDNIYSNSLWLYRPIYSFNILTVKENYITQIVTMRRSSRKDSYKIYSRTDFNINSTGYEIINNRKYKILNVIESTQYYKNDQPYGEPKTKTYQKYEEIN